MEKLFDLFTDNQGVHVYQTQKISILLRDIQFYYPHLIILQNFGYYLHLTKPATQVSSLG